MSMNSTYSHRAMGDLWIKEHRMREAHSCHTQELCTVYGTPRRRYRPIMGITGTLQETPNPNMERDRLPLPLSSARLPQADLADRTEHRIDQLPPLLASPRLEPLDRAPRPAIDRRAEANLSYGIPPHQVHHHNFGWTNAGAKPVATVFSPRRPWGIGLQYANEINPFSKQIRDCPGSPRGFSPPSPRRTGAHSQFAMTTHASQYSGMMWKQSSQQASTAQLSTAAPSDFGGASSEGGGF